MSIQRLVISALAIIASCHASGIGHLSPVVKSFPIVRYTPFFNFPNGGRSIHSVAPAHLPAPLFPAPVPAAAFPTPVFPGPAFSAPHFYDPAPAPLPAPVPAPVHFAPQPFFAPSLRRVVPFVPSPSRIASLIPSLPNLGPIAPALAPAPFYARAVHALPATPFSPIIRPVAPAPAFPAPVFASAPAPLSFQAYAPHLHYAPAPLFKQGAWK